MKKKEEKIRHKQEHLPASTIDHIVLSVKRVYCALLLIHSHSNDCERF